MGQWAVFVCPKEGNAREIRGNGLWKIHAGQGIDKFGDNLGASFSPDLVDCHFQVLCPRGTLSGMGGIRAEGKSLCYLITRENDRGGRGLAEGEA